MGKINPKFHGLSQFQAPLNFELAGKHFHFVMDDGREYSFNFLDGEVVQWAGKGEPYIWDTYECLKADETTFFVHIQPNSNRSVRYAWIIDTAQRLVTEVFIEEDTDPIAGVMKVTPFFGAIKVPGRELPEARHHFSSRMVGKHIFWHYNPAFSLQHIYHSETSIRADSGVDKNGNRIIPRTLYDDELHSPDPEIRKYAEERVKAYEERETYYPFYEEPCFHIWINDHLNLLGFAEEIMIRRDPEHTHGGGGIILLQDIERVVDFGLCFSRQDYCMATAYGEENEDFDPLDTEPTPYDWTEVTAFPSIHWDVKDKD